jgi:hypothetical protein
MNDVWTTMEAFANMDIPSTAAPDPAYSAWLWTPFRGASPYDFIWGVNSSSLNAMGQGVTDYNAAPGAAAMNAQFGATANCISGIVMSQQIAVGALGNIADRKADALVETFSCTLHDGVAPSAVDDAAAFFKTQKSKISSAALKTYAAWLWKPFRGGTGEADYMWVGAYPDVKNWTQGDTDYYASTEGQAADAKFAAVGRCRSAIWQGYWITVAAQP